MIRMIFLCRNTKPSKAVRRAKFVDDFFHIRIIVSMNAYLILFFAIVFEVVATSLVKVSNGFSNLVPTVILLVFYGMSFYLLSLSVKEIPLGIAYAIWSGVGIVIISIAGVFIFKQHLDAPAIGGITLIMLGCLIINLFSKSSAH